MRPPPGTLLLLSVALGPPSPSASASSPGIPSPDEALLDDMLTSYLGHEPSSCHGDGSDDAPGTTSFTFDWPGPGEGSEWYGPHAGYERELFLAEMSHDDTSGLAEGSNGTAAGDNSTGYNATVGNSTESFPEENLSYLKTAWQSSTSYGAEASRAVDGNTDGHFWGESLLEK